MDQIWFLRLGAWDFGFGGSELRIDSMGLGYKPGVKANCTDRSRGDFHPKLYGILVLAVVWYS
jgi:hypothetical protein